MGPGTPAELLLTPFGKYTLLSRLSFGGMAELFLAVQHFALGFQKLVVVKRILPSRRNDPTFVDLFLREARIAATLSHPNVVQTLDAGELDGTYFIVMEHVPGEDLRSVLRAVKHTGGEALPLEHALHVAIGVCAGLAYVHEKRGIDGEELRIVHGDISTHNVVLSFGGDVKIVDFGIATSDGADEGTDAHRIKGKPRYMSPEQAAGEVLDARTDIFSLGVVLFELTTGQRLFHATGRSPGAEGMRDAAYARPSEASPGYPRALERIVMRALEPNRADRYPSARAMQADIEQFVRDEGIVISPLETSAWMHSMFETKIDREHETLRGIDDLVTTVGPRAEILPPVEPEAGGSSTAAGETMAVGGSIAPHAMAPERAPRWRVGAPLVALSALLSAAAVFVYMRHDAAIRLAEAARHAREEAAARPVAPPEPAGAVEVITHPDGCAISVDGVSRSEATPARLDALPIGRELHLTLSKDGYDPAKTTVTLTADAPFKDLEIELKKRTGTLVVQFPPPAPVDVWVDGKRYTGDRARIEGLSPEHEHVIGFAAPGYEPKTYRVLLQPGQTKPLNVWMPKVAAPTPE